MALSANNATIRGSGGEGRGVEDSGSISFNLTRYPLPFCGIKASVYTLQLLQRTGSHGKAKDKGSSRAGYGMDFKASAVGAGNA